MEDRPPALTIEAFRLLLLTVRDGASAELADRLIADQHEAGLAGLRAVWHAAEAGLGVLLLNQAKPYIVKREAMYDLVELVERYGDSEDSP